MKLRKNAERLIVILRDNDWHIKIEYSIFYSCEIAKLCDKDGYHKSLSIPAISTIKKLAVAGVLECEKIDSVTKKYYLTEKYRNNGIEANIQSNQ